MTVDFVLPTFEGGGAQRVVGVLANQLAERGYKINIVTFGDGERYEVNARVNRVRLHRQLAGRSKVLNAFLQLLLYYRKKENRPDIISIHNCYLVTACVPISVFYKIKSTISEHLHHKSESSRVLNMARKYLYPKAEVVTVLTNYDVTFFEDKAKKVLVMPNPCPFPVVEDVALDRVLRKRMVAIGDLDRYKSKGFDSLIQVVTPLFADYPDWKLVIAGEGNEGKRQLENRIATSGLEAHVELIGFQENVPELMQASDIFVLSSRYEGLPMSLIEAMSQGVACVAYNCKTGPSEIIENEVTGLLVEDQNEQALAVALRRLIQDDVLRGGLAEKAPESIAQKFSKNVISEKWERLLNAVHQE